MSAKALIPSQMWENKDGPRRCVNTVEGLTHSSGTSREGLAMKATSERFFAKVDRTDECWIWTGSQAGGGYGDFYLGKINGRNVNRPAHRWSYEYAYGPIPTGLQIDHLCRNRLCVRPDHLEAVTQAENIRRGAAVITHCPQQHPYSPENTYRAARGDRQCRECMRQRARAARSNPTRPNEARKETA